MFPIENFSKAFLGLAIVTPVLFSGCLKQSGEALVTEKEHIAIREGVSPTPTPAEPSGSPSVAAEKAEDEDYRPLPPDEIVVDGSVMKAEVRGTGRDPRATDREQWLVKVELVRGGRKLIVQADQPLWEKWKVGDRVNVTYREGKYTGTVWSAEIK